MGFIDAQNFWASRDPQCLRHVADSVLALPSGDGGATWTLFQQETPITLPINMQFVDANHGSSPKRQLRQHAERLHDGPPRHRRRRSYVEVDPPRVS